MGVSGSGKSTVGEALARRLGTRFVDADTLHPARNIELMSAGVPLTDADRASWLDRVAAAYATGPSDGPYADGPSADADVAGPSAGGQGVVVACSALKRAYRDRIGERVPRLMIVQLVAEPSVLRARLDARQGHFMPASLLASQLAALEDLAPDERGAQVNVDASPAAVVDAALAAVDKWAGLTGT